MSTYQNAEEAAILVTTIFDAYNKNIQQQGGPPLTGDEPAITVDMGKGTLSVSVKQLLNLAEFVLTMEEA